ncbi:MAG: tetratricopeptide repeat protein [Candidatus Eremiobacteraeota bacterium]|nr:tetratricopeptide repeat protein [Candidatus Eremiobacteraeota bacterium]
MVAMDYLEGLKSEGELHGSGTFSADLHRMQQVLGSFQIADPEEFVLPLLAAAVLNGSHWFRLEQKGATTRLSWSEPALDLEQLQRILPSLGQAGSLLSELGIALLAARRLGTVSFQTPHGRAFFVGDQLVVDDHAGPAPNCLTLTRPWWQRAIGRPRLTSHLLTTRGRYAGLQLTPRRPPAPVVTPLAFKTTGLDPDWISAHDWVELPPNPWGEGVLYFGQGDWQLIRHGVSYPFAAPIAGVVALWWSDGLPLDLSRKQVVHGTEFKNWLSWIHDQLSEVVLNRGFRQHFAALVASSRASQLPLLLEAPIFRRADGSIACLSQIREEYLEHGWLPVVSYAMQIEWEPHRVLIVDHPHEKQLCALFSNWINLDHLQGQINLPRLPNPEDYVVRIPFLKGRGEAGLRRYPDLHGFREFIREEVLEQRTVPEGVDAAREGKGLGVLPIGELYWTLRLMKFSGPFEHLERYHFLQMFVWLKLAVVKRFTKEYARRHPLDVLLDPKSQFQISHCRGVIRAKQLQEIADRLSFDSHSGEKVPLRQLGKSVRYLTVGRNDGPANAVVSPVGEAIALMYLFLPGALEETSPASVSRPITNTALRLLRGATSPTELLSRFLRYRECSAHQMLRVADLLDLMPDPSPNEGADQLQRVVRRARDEMRSEERELNTAYLLVALADEPSCGLERERLLPLLLEWAEYENERELHELRFMLEGDPKGNSDQILYRYFMLAWSHLRSRRWQDARELVRAKLSVPPIKAAGLMVTGLSESLVGNWEAALRHHRQAAELDPHPSYATCVAENLMWLGRLDEARAALPDSEEQYPLMIRASLAETPEEQLRLCDRTEQAGRGQYFELAELRGQAYFQLGDYQKARECLARFLEARLDNSLLDMFEERQQRARELLLKCERS